MTVTSDSEISKQQNTIFEGGNIMFNFLIKTVFLLAVTAPIFAQQWPVHMVESNLTNPSPYVANLDGDDDDDILAIVGSSLIWYENQMNGSAWLRHIIESSFSGLSSDGTIDIFDMDRDNDLDFVINTPANPGLIAWYENRENAAQWIKHVISDTARLAANRIHSYGDMDNDGDIDIVSPEMATGQIHWFENVQGDTIWQGHLLASIPGAIWTSVADMDGDVDLDVVAGSYTTGDLYWFENQMNGTSWQTHAIGNSNGCFIGFVADIDNDQDKDLVTRNESSNTVILFENTGAAWEMATIASGPYILPGGICDMNGDQYLDIIFGGLGILGWIENTGGPATGWIQHTIASGFGPNVYVFPINGLSDIDGDNDLDIMTGTINYSNFFLIGDIRWYENPAPPYVHNFQVNCTYAIPGVDTLLIIASVENPENHTLSVLAKFKNKEDVVLDSTFLFDDANHNDGLAGDKIWGGFWQVPPGELQYFIDIRTKDIDSGIIKTQRNVSSFTTIGPVRFQYYKITSPDTFPNPGNMIPLKLTLKNLGTSATATKITTVLSSNDTNVVSITSGNPNYNDIAPGNISTSNGIYVIKFAPNSPGGKSIPFKVDIFSDNCLFWSDNFSVFLYPTGIAENQTKELPQKFALHQNFPNPFNSSTTIEFALPQSSFVTLKIYNLLGEEIATLIAEKREAGIHQFHWDATGLESGVYFYRLDTEKFVQTRKILLLK